MKWKENPIARPKGSGTSVATDDLVTTAASDEGKPIAPKGFRCAYGSILVGAAVTAVLLPASARAEDSGDFGGDDGDIFGIGSDDLGDSGGGDAASDVPNDSSDYDSCDGGDPQADCT